MDILQVLKYCQNQLQAGYTSTKNGGPRWLKEVCHTFEQFCRLCHKLLANVDSDEKLLDETLLCCSQIADCLGWLNRAMRLESERNCVLSICRQHFLDRITCCIKVLTTSIADHQKRQQRTRTNAVNAKYEENFVTSIDYALDLLQPLTMFGDADGECADSSAIVSQTKETKSDENCSAARAEITLTSQHIRSACNSLVGHALTFANVALADDRLPLTTVCKTVLAKCADFVIAASFDANTDKPSDTANLPLCATALENSLYQLDGLLNDALLRLACAAFTKLNAKPLQQMRTLIASNATQQTVDTHIELFDQLTDRLHQIGIYAAAFAGTNAARVRIRSALATAEALEPLLVPTMLTASTTLPADPNVDLLAMHWTDEMERLQQTVHSVIDTNAMCGCMYDQMTAEIAKQQRGGANRVDVVELLRHFDVLMQHLWLNRGSLLLFAENDGGKVLNMRQCDRRLEYSDLSLMLDECRAAADACNVKVAEEWARVVKRLKILQRVLHKFRATLDAEDGKKTAIEVQDDVLVKESAEESDRALEKAGVKRNYANILFGSSARRESVLEPRVLQPQQQHHSSQQRQTFATKSSQQSLNLSTLSISSTPSNRTVGKCGGQRRVALTKKSSLRTALFRRVPIDGLTKTTTETDDDRSNVKSDSGESSVDLNLSLDLHITDILEQITDLSNTLSNGL